MLVICSDWVREIWNGDIALEKYWVYVDVLTWFIFYWQQCNMITNDGKIQNIKNQIQKLFCVDQDKDHFDEEINNLRNNSGGILKFEVLRGLWSGNLIIMKWDTYRQWHQRHNIWFIPAPPSFLLIHKHNLVFSNPWFFAERLVWWSEMAGPQKKARKPSESSSDGSDSENHYFTQVGTPLFCNHFLGYKHMSAFFRKYKPILRVGIQKLKTSMV